jgi:hypothetical protein
MSTLAIAVLLASLVAKDAVQPKRAAIIGAAVFSLVGLAFLQHPVPILLSAPLAFASLWGSLLFVQRATGMLLPLAVVSVLGAVGVTESLHEWLVVTLQMRDSRTQERLDDFKRQHPDAGTDGGVAGT